MLVYGVLLLLIVGGIFSVWFYKKTFRRLNENIFRVIPDMVFILDGGLRISRLYNPDKRYLLVEPADLPGTNLQEYFPVEDITLFQQGVDYALKENKPFEAEYALTIEGDTAYFEARFTRLKEDTVACMIRNISKRKKGELAIKQNQEFVNSVLDNIPFPVMLKDLNDNLRYIYWNKECDNQAGFKRDEIIGKTDIDLFGKERGGRYRDIDLQVAASGKMYVRQEEYITPEGNRHDTIVTKNVITNGMNRWLLVIRRDITDLIKIQHALKDTNQLNQLILNNSNVGFIFIGPDYVVKWENISKYMASSILMAYRKGELCYKNVRGFDHPCEGCIMEKAIHSEKTERVEVVFEGGIVTEIVATPVWNERKQLEGVVLKVEEITEKKRVERELLEAKDNAEKSDRLKSAFLANMSHEIRTPLNAIVGFSELLCSTSGQTDREKYMEIIRCNNQVLLQLINDILDLSKIEAGALDFFYNYVDINPLLEKFSKNTDGDKHIEILFKPASTECIIYTEENRLMQVMSHLISNALKFTNQGKIVFGYEIRDKEIYFYVSDTGIGIPRAKQREIFQRFVKLDSFKNGTGLGLPLCEVIVKKMHGKIGVESELGKGSTFWFTLPYQPKTDNK